MQINASSVMLSYSPPVYNNHSKPALIYQIKHRKLDTKEWTTNNSSNTWYNATNLIANSIYEFRVVASYDGKAFGPDSDTLWFRTAGKL